MSGDILVVYKKNFEEVHDRSLDEVRRVLDELVGERGLNVGYTARETVRRADFVEPDLVIVLGGDGTLTSIAHSVDENTPVMGVNSHPRVEGNGGSYGVGNRMKIKYTRAMLNAALDGDLDDVSYIVDDRFGFEVPETCPNVPSEVLQPIHTWSDNDSYNETADNLAKMFVDNFKRYEAGVSDAVNASSPRTLAN